MSLDLTRQSFLTNTLYIIVLGIMFWGSGLITPDFSAQPAAGTPLAELIDRAFKAIPILGIILSFGLVFINSIVVTRICVKNAFFIERSYMPALIYVIVCSVNFNSFMAFRPLLVSTLILVATSITLGSYKQKVLATGTYLNIGFYLGLAATIWPPALMIAPLLPISLILMRLFSLREWIAAGFGYSLPLLLAAYTDWLMGGDIAVYITNFTTAISTPSNNMPSLSEISIIEWGLISTLGILVILSILKFFTRRKASHIKINQSYLYFVWMLIITLMIITLAPCRSMSMLPILATSLSVLIPTYFNAAKPSLIMNILYALLIFESIAIHVLPRVL